MRQGGGGGGGWRRRSRGEGYLEDSFSWIPTIFVIEIYVFDTTSYEDIAVIAFLIESNNTSHPQGFEQRDIAFRREGKNTRGDFPRSAHWTTKGNEFPRNDPGNVSVFQFGEMIVFENIKRRINKMTEAMNAIESTAAIQDSQRISVDGKGSITECCQHWSHTYDRR
jgi:hypothetical protein